MKQQLTSVKGLVRGYRIRCVLIRVCACIKLIRVCTRVGVGFKGVYNVCVPQEGYKGVTL